MVAPDQNEMFDVLEKQRQHQRQVDRVLKIVLPIVAFLMAVICANMNIWSPIFTFAILWIAFYWYRPIDDLNLSFRICKNFWRQSTNS